MGQEDTVSDLVWVFLWLHYTSDPRGLVVREIWRESDDRCIYGYQ